MHFSTRSRLFGALFAIVAVLGVGAGVLFQFTPRAQAHAVAHVRVLHAGADAPAVNVLVNNTAAVTNLSFGHITGYLSLNPAASYDIKVVPASSPSTVVFEIPSARFSAGYTTVAAIGLLNPGTTGHAFTLKVYSDDNRNASGRARVRVVHDSPNAPAVDIYAEHRSSAAKAVSGLNYPNATGYLAVQPGFYAFAVAASPSSSVKQAIYTTPRAHLLPDNTYTAWAIGTLGNNFTVLLTHDAGNAGNDDQGGDD